MTKRPLFFYGWVILGLSFFGMVLAHAARNSFSVFYVPILDEFGWTRASTAGVFSANAIAYGITGPFAGALVDRFGPKRVLLIGGTILTLAVIFCSRANTIYYFYLLFGVVNGIGGSLIAYPAGAAVLPHWFVRRRGMAFGILTSGSGISFLMIPVVQYLITRFGWRISLVWFGAIIGAIMLPLAALFSRHRPQDMGLLPDGAHSEEKVRTSLDSPQNRPGIDKELKGADWTLGRAMRTYRFWLIFGTFFCFFGIVQNLIIAHQIALITDVGFSSTFAVSIVALWGAMKVAGNLTSFLSDKIGREKAFMSGCLASILGLLMLVLVQEKSYSWILLFYAVFFGIGTGMSGPVLGAATADIFHGKSFGSINGCMTLGFGLGGIVGPWFGGFVFDTTKSYSGSLVAAILVVCVACAFLWIAAPRKIRSTG